MDTDDLDKNKKTKNKKSRGILIKILRAPFKILEKPYI
jgi:hypothetical protein